MHVDMDAFYASVEIARNPALAHRPMWVGGAHRGVVLSANYPARRHGVEGGMPSVRARRLCPDGVAIAPDFEAYTRVSAGVFAIFGSVTSQVETASIDEAFLDVTGAQQQWGPALQIAELIRARVADEQHITCTVGIAPNRYLAKLVSSAAKPDGARQLHVGQVVDFLHPLPVERLWGVGPATATKLQHLGLQRVGQVANTPVQVLQRALGHQLGQWLHQVSWGRDERRVTPDQIERSIGAQSTFPADTDAPGLIRAEILRMAERATGRMRRSAMMGRAVTLTLRFADFSVLSRTTTLSSPTDVTDEVYAAALRELDALHLQRVRIRRVGVRIEQLVDRDEAYQQYTLDAPERGMREVEQSADAIIARFGPHAVQRGTILDQRPS